MMTGQVFPCEKAPNISLNDQHWGMMGLDCIQVGQYTKQTPSLITERGILRNVTRNLIGL